MTSVRCFHTWPFVQPRLMIPTRQGGLINARGKQTHETKMLHVYVYYLYM